jgi:hypothetical protein
VTPRISFANGLGGRQSFPTSNLLDVFGLRFNFEVAYGAQQSLGGKIAKTGYAHLPDVQSYLREELRAAFAFLADPHNQQLWGMCTPELVTDIRSQNWDSLLAKRRAFREQVRVLTGSEPLQLRVKSDETGNQTIEPIEVSKTRQVSRTSALAWCILVDAALLTDRLIRDMKETATAKGKYTPDCEAWRDYFHPNPSPEARRAFNEYVALRWPVRVFALDPSTQDQNISDTYSSRREMQLALAIAFTNGLISANTMTKYARRLELNAETIALNRPQIGFGHGENVFGWRFTPRYQTPDTRSNLAVFLRDQVVGGPNREQLLRERRLEPGMRECVAVVMMPSFVPYVQLDTTSNWFALANPKHKKLDHTQALHLSRTVQAIKTESCSVRDADKYRDGEFDRLRKRAEQLEARLPTQTIVAPVPVLNTLGGFEMFSNGTTDLAPELYGWYGAPGLDPEADKTTLFLVGDHFSPLRTRVVVGNQEIDAMTAQQKMLSRQVMQITIPRGSYVTDGKEVRIHMATPYGVTRELAVPAVSKVKKAEAAKPAAAEGFTLKTPKLTVAHLLVPDGKGRFNLVARPATADPKVLAVTFDDATGSAPEKIRVTFAFKYRGTDRTLPCEVSDVTYDRGRAQYLVPVDGLVTDLLTLAGTAGPVDSPGTAAFEGLTRTVKVIVTPVEPGRATKSVEAGQQLEIEFTGEIAVCPPAEPKKGEPAPPAGVPAILPSAGAGNLGAEPFPQGAPPSLPPAAGGR